MIEVRFHGRGGQGAVVASTILANAAFMEGKNVQAFPYFGVERRGAPVTAFTRISDEPIRIRSEIYEPDHVIVLDTFILTSVDVASGLKDGGTILINSRKKPYEFNHLKSGKNAKLACVDATSIALENRLGSKVAPIVNTAILGGFVKLTNIVEIESLLKSVRENVPIKPDENVKAAKEAYHKVVLEDE